jgi:hypothetical protein
VVGNVADGGKAIGNLFALESHLRHPLRPSPSS